MSIVRLLRHRFLRKGSFGGWLQEGPLLKLLVYSGAISPPHSTHAQQGGSRNEAHTAHHNHLLTVEPCLQQTISIPLPLLSPVYDTAGLGDGGLLDWGGILWAVPKKRTSHSKKRMRMAHKYLKPKGHYTVCPKCQNLKLLHVLCGHCLKETLRETAKMRRAQIEKKLLSGWGDGGGGVDVEEQSSSSETAAR